MKRTIGALAVCCLAIPSTWIRAEDGVTALAERSDLDGPAGQRLRRETGRAGDHDEPPRRQQVGGKTVVAQRFGDPGQSGGADAGAADAGARDGGLGECRGDRPRGFAVHTQSVRGPTDKFSTRAPTGRQGVRGNVHRTRRYVEGRRTCPRPNRRTFIIM